MGDEHEDQIFFFLRTDMSLASEEFRKCAARTLNEEDDDEDAYPDPDPSQVGDLATTPALTAAFCDSLKRYGVELRFFSGSWATFDLRAAGGKYDIVMTSETIYRVESLPSLLDIMWLACTGGFRSLEDITRDLNITSSRSTNREDDYLCVVAAKLVYFGVGGGVSEFIDAVENAQSSRCSRCCGAVDTIWKNHAGIKRVIMKVRWK